MLIDFSTPVLDLEGKPIFDQEPERTEDGKVVVVPGTNQAVMKKKADLPLMFWVKQVCGTRLEGDPETRDHYRKMMALCARLDRATEGKVELSTDSVTWIRNRFLKSKLIAPVVMAFEQAADPLREEEIAAL